MEIKIDSKRNNPLLNRTEIYFTVKHEGEGTPNRELIRSELAEKLNAKKENIVINVISPGFGLQESTGYAKVYSSIQKTKDLEREHILLRNKIIGSKEKTEGKPAETTSPSPKEEPSEDTSEKEVSNGEETVENSETVTDGKPAESSSETKVEKTTSEETTVDETVEQPSVSEPVEKTEGKPVEQQNVESSEKIEEDAEKPMDEKKSSEEKEE